MVIRLEVEHAFGMGQAFLLDHGLEQLLLVFEVDVERALRDAGGAGDVVHAGGIEALGQEDRAGAFDDLAAFGAVFRDAVRCPFAVICALMSAFLPVYFACFS